MNMPRGILVDAKNWFDLKQSLIDEVTQAGIIGFDIETQDDNRHDGLNRFMKVDDEGHKSKGKKLIFDTRRTVVTGFSWYCDKASQGYYLNLAHADVGNRIPWSEAKQILDARQAEAQLICHNATFERTMMLTSLGYDLGPNVICTLQMSVSTFNEDTYPRDKMLGVGFGAMVNLMRPISEAFGTMADNGDLDERQSDLLGKIIGKTSTSSFSYNNLVDGMTYGYGLKALTKSLFGYEQTTFAEVMDGSAHMGQLTGDEVCQYGAEDAYWCVQIFHKLLPMLAEQNDVLIDTFFNQENPMTQVFSDIWHKGMRIDLTQVEQRRITERGIYASTVRDLQALVRNMLPFPDDPNKWMMDSEEWYSKSSGKTYRKRIEDWAKMTLSSDDFTCAHSTSGAVSNAWAEDNKVKKSTGPNFSHYMMMRTLMYDLPGIKPLMSGGKIGSDKDIRQKLLKNEKVAPLIKLIDAMASIETRMKLYLTPYLMLIDPDTQRIYPVVSSMLNSRRMAASFPNPMQLAKRGESVYIRGFFLPDEDDHVIISIDWSQIELVLIGDFSNDSGFHEAYGQIPFNDLHWKAVASGMGMSVEEAKALPNGKALRTTLGKGSNFNYWYSGALSTVADMMGWSSAQMWEKTEAYRETFPEAEEWRTGLIAEARDAGFVTLPDGHRRIKYEATYEWQRIWKDRFNATGDEGLMNFGRLFVQRLTSRAGNQIVNSMIQGSCATLAKRSILRVNAKIKEFDLRARFMMPIHDELVFSVHRDDVIRFLKMARFEMCNHLDIITRLCVDATASIGRTFEPFSATAPMGQIELDEAPLLPNWLAPETKDTRLDEGNIQRVIDYLFQERKAA